MGSVKAVQDPFYPNLSFTRHRASLELTLPLTSRLGFEMFEPTLVLFPIEVSIGFDIVVVGMSESDSLIFLVFILRGYVCVFMNE